jgi:hypothetical protein
MPRPDDAPIGTWDGDAKRITQEMRDAVEKQMNKGCNGK